MGTAKAPEPARLFVAVMYAPGAAVDAVLGALRERFGATAQTHGPVAFGFTEYYTPEMGPGLLKTYLVYERPFERAQLADVKNWTNALELQHARDGSRTVNIDPGYLCRDKLVLASTKDFYHRLYLGEGIYAEVTLHFRGGHCRHFSWTYADYKTPQVQAMLIAARAEIAGFAPVNQKSLGRIR
jgi:hypothetical protein